MEDLCHDVEATVVCSSLPSGRSRSDGEDPRSIEGATSTRPGETPAPGSISRRRHHCRWEHRQGADHYRAWIEHLSAKKKVEACDSSSPSDDRPLRAECHADGEGATKGRDPPSPSDGGSFHIECDTDDTMALQDMAIRQVLPKTVGATARGGYVGVPDLMESLGCSLLSEDDNDGDLSSSLDDGSYCIGQETFREEEFHHFHILSGCDISDIENSEKGWSEVVVGEAAGRAGIEYFQLSPNFEDEAGVEVSLSVEADCDSKEEVPPTKPSEGSEIIPVSSSKEAKETMATPTASLSIIPTANCVEEGHTVRAKATGMKEAATTPTTGLSDIADTAGMKDVAINSFTSCSIEAEGASGKEPVIASTSCRSSAANTVSTKETAIEPEHAVGLAGEPTGDPPEAEEQVEEDWGGAAFAAMHAEALSKHDSGDVARGPAVGVTLPHAPNADRTTRAPAPAGKGVFQSEAVFPSLSCKNMSEAFPGTEGGDCIDGTVTDLIAFWEKVHGANLSDELEGLASRVRRGEPVLLEEIWELGPMALSSGPARQPQACDEDVVMGDDAMTASCMPAPRVKWIEEEPSSPTLSPRPKHEDSGDQEEASRGDNMICGDPSIAPANAEEPMPLKKMDCLSARVAPVADQEDIMSIECDLDVFRNVVSDEAGEGAILPEISEERRMPQATALNAIARLSPILPQLGPIEFVKGAVDAVGGNPSIPTEKDRVQEEYSPLTVSSPVSSPPSQQGGTDNLTERNDQEVANRSPSGEDVEKSNTPDIHESATDGAILALTPTGTQIKNDGASPKCPRHEEISIKLGILRNGERGDGIRLYNGQCIRDFTKCTASNCRWRPRIQPTKSACERCWMLASAQEREEFASTGRHLRIAMSYGGCSGSCTLCPHVFASPSSSSRGDGRGVDEGGEEEDGEEGGLCLCRRCFDDLHHTGIRAPL